MSHFLSGASARRVVESVQKLERSLRTAGLPLFVARLPVCWLCWYYCRMLDQKIARMKRIAGKFDRWGPTIREISPAAQEKLEMLDLDRSMRTDIEYTKSTMLELRDYCIDIGRMFEQLGYESAALKRRQQLFMEILDLSCASASRMQDALTRHDDAVLAMLRAQADAAAAQAARA
ncbi:hypothetical protein GJ699_30235 [Duganella sp. FT80W]|uniref:Uncharacterized protein n=1 Tax=Duganella guangzhouensis TaxID=2666084 RepID=A0A6I2L987_9BURK|nr:hypothetical protein [Duganella guangzhouensis]MRW94262.1 hypothetical protein [Duganella guangzhouensis]